MFEKLSLVKKIQDTIFPQCGFEMGNFVAENEGLDYCAHHYTLNKKVVVFRIAKKTPLKTGSFVTLWKRNHEGVVAPYDELDVIDFLVVSIINGDDVGQFIFPKAVLLSKNILSKNNQGGKRALRVYSPWDSVNSAQAIKTQKWQSQYFIELLSKNEETVERMKFLYSSKNNLMY